MIAAGPRIRSPMAKNPAALVDTSAMRSVSTRGMTVSAFVLKGKGDPERYHRRTSAALGLRTETRSRRKSIVATYVRRRTPALR
jgi:hypothetical protein